MKKNTFKLVTIGVSAGGFEALHMLLPGLPAAFRPAVIVVQHTCADSDNYIVRSLDKVCRLRVQEAAEKQKIRGGRIYVAPPSYHLLIEMDRTFALSMDQPVFYSRPAIDMLFDCAAEVYREQVIGIILSGANQDGAQGLKKIKQLGGVTLVQAPNDAAFPVMPQKAIAASPPDYIRPLSEIAPLLVQLEGGGSET